MRTDSIIYFALVLVSILLILEGFIQFKFDVMLNFKRILLQDTTLLSSLHTASFTFMIIKTLMGNGDGLRYCFITYINFRPI